jgi:cell division protein ZapA (FtsZ GTPase activity inhibitor)
MTQKNTVEVVIAQQRLSLKTDQDPERVQKVADMVNDRLATILPFNQPVSHQVLMLLAMTLAEDLLKSQEEEGRFRADIKQRSQSLLTQLEREFPL